MLSSRFLTRILCFHVLCILCFSFTDSIEWIGLWRVKPVRSTSEKISKERSTGQTLPSQIMMSNNESSKKKITLLFSSGCANARRAGYLKGKQTKICQKYLDVMPYVALASLLTIKVCEETFRLRRWNCLSLSFAPNLTVDLKLGTREQAFVYSLASAAVAHGTAKACSSGSVLSCSCGKIPQEPPIGAFKWGGCADNLRFGTKFSRLFVDSPWKRKKLTKELMTLINRHNNKAGRKILKESITRQCKCHGVSGSCNVMTCWQTLPKLLDIGERLMRKYQTAIEVAPSEDSMSHKIVPVNVELKTELPPDQLIYITKSPDYCTADHKVGSLGTHRRSCNASSQDTDSCDSMCCGRGYESSTQEKIERCFCKYHWCCYVKCKTCRKLVQVNQCN